MQSLWLKEKVKYDGEQLKPLFNYLNHGILGDSVVGWVGPCDVTPEHMIDGEDLRAGATIASDEMLHLVIELFQFPISSAVALQRLLGEILLTQLNEQSDLARELKRTGDDLYLGSKKLNVSIATCSSTSSLIHFGVNVKNDGTPVETCALADFGIIDVATFADQLMARLKDEVLGIRRAMVKVRSF